MTGDSGRIFFSNTGRSLIEEDVIELSSVGVDIGSSTSHLLFSTIVLERLDSRYVVAERIVRHQSDILITPYTAENTIDADRLGNFIAAEYKKAGISPDEIDTGALILTGVAVRRENARAIGELFAAEAGKFVAVSAGDGLETLMAAHGSGALALSIRNGHPVLNIDVGGGTTKIALCVDGEVATMTAIEAGARLVVVDGGGRIERIEPTGRAYLDELGLTLNVGDGITDDQRDELANAMADQVCRAMRGEDLGARLRLPPLSYAEAPGDVIVSGGVSEYFYGREAAGFGDLGRELGAALRSKIEAMNIAITEPLQGIRATVVGASQYTVQVSGSTIYMDPPETLPLTNIAVIAPELDLSGEEIDKAVIEDGVKQALIRLDLNTEDQPVAIAFPWAGTASFARLQALCQGLIAGVQVKLDAEHPLILVIDGDIGGLLGIHCREEEKLATPIVSIDGIQLREFDFIDIGEVLRSTGAVPVVIKSLLFPEENSLAA